MRTFVIPSRKEQHQGGQTAVEFAVVATVFFLLLFAIIQMGLVIYTYNTVASATREAVRYAALNGPNRNSSYKTMDLKTFVLNHEAALNSSNLTVTVSWPDDQNLPAQQDALVTTSYNYRVDIPFLSPVTLTLRSTSQMMVEQ